MGVLVRQAGILAMVASLAAAAPSTSAPDRFAILEPGEGNSDIRSCSRPTPPEIKVFWKVPLSEARRIDAAIDTLLAPRPGRPDSAGGKHPVLRMQLLGIVLDGDSLVYVNGLPRWMGVERDRTHLLYDVCDGGVGYWGAVWDPRRGIFRDLQFNGES
jgi:hypothetical protein